MDVFDGSVHFWDIGAAIFGIGGVGILHPVGTVIIGCDIRRRERCKNPIFEPVIAKLRFAYHQVGEAKDSKVRKSCQSREIFMS